MKSIEITVSPDARFEIDAQGFSGNNCLDAARDLLVKLGVDEDQVEKKIEARLDSDLDQNQDQGHGV